MRAAALAEIPIVDIYVLQGDDDLAVQDDLKAIYARLRAEGSSELDIAALRRPRLRSVRADPIADIFVPVQSPTRGGPVRRAGNA